MNQRKAHHSYETKEDLVLRLKKIEGQVRGISGMIENDLYCDDILHQISSVQAALNSVSKLLLEAHIKSCVAEQLQEGKHQVIDELMITIAQIYEPLISEIREKSISETELILKAQDESGERPACYGPARKCHRRAFELTSRPN